MFKCLRNRMKMQTNSCGNLSAKIWQMIMPTHDFMHYPMHLKYGSYNAVKRWMQQHEGTQWSQRNSNKFVMHISALLLLEISCCWSTVLLLTPFKYFTFWSAKIDSKAFMNIFFNFWLNHDWFAFYLWYFCRW